MLVVSRKQNELISVRLVIDAPPPLKICRGSPVAAGEALVVSKPGVSKAAIAVLPQDPAP